MSVAAARFPGRAPIDAYGNGGFRFADMSHRGSILCLPSGIYAAWLRAGDDEDYLLFTVRPPRGTTRSRIAVLMSTVTYVTYANFTDIGRDAWREGAYTGDATAQPYADPSLSRDVYGYDLLLLRPDMHVAWRGNALPAEPAALAAMATGH